MPVYDFRTRPYARNIYLYGTYSFDMIPSEYVEPVKRYARETFSKEEIDNALNMGWITERQYNETISCKTAP